MKRMYVVFGIIFLGIQAADLPNESNKPSEKRIDYSTLFRKSGLNDDPTNIFFYLEDKNQEALQQFIVQAKKDGRIDVLEKALEYAVKGKKRNAINILLAEGAPISKDLIEQTVAFFTQYNNEMDAEVRRHYKRKEQVYASILRNIIDIPDRKVQFNFMVNYLTKTKNTRLLTWLLGVVIELNNISYVEQLINQGVFIVNQVRLEHTIQILTTFKNTSKNDADKKRIQAIIDKLIYNYGKWVDSHERHTTMLINEQRRGQ